MVVKFYNSVTSYYDNKLTTNKVIVIFDGFTITFINVYIVKDKCSKYVTGVGLLNGGFGKLSQEIEDS